MGNFSIKAIMLYMNLQKCTYNGKFKAINISLVLGLHQFSASFRRHGQTEFHYQCITHAIHV